MMMLYFYLNISALFCSFIALLYGCIQLTKRKQGTYFKIALMGMALLFLAYLFNFLYAGLAGGYTSGFSIGYLGMIGAFSFLYTANRSYISVLEDADTKHKHKASRIAFLLPAILLAEFMVVAIKVGLKATLIPPFLLLVITGASSYFAFREVLLPDVKNGFIDCMRPFNMLTCIFAVLCSACEILYVYESVLPNPDSWYIALCVLGDATMILLSLTLHRGIEKWVR